MDAKTTETIEKRQLILTIVANRKGEVVGNL